MVTRFEMEFTINKNARRINRCNDEFKGAVTEFCEAAAVALVMKAITESGFQIVPTLEDNETR